VQRLIRKGKAQLGENYDNTTFLFQHGQKPSDSITSEAMLKNTNAARASHPSRIVIADVLTAVLRFRGGSSRNRTPESAMHRCLPEACASGYDSALPFFSEEEL
jgi:hypothetical protein